MLSLTALLSLNAAFVAAAPARRATNGYVPVSTTCPATQLVRQANGVSSAEAEYISHRYEKATTALNSWLTSLNAGFETSHEKRQWNSWQPQNKAPVIALTSSGGGYRAQLTGAGVVKGFDNREVNKTAVSGLYQAFTYHSGLSGGSWLLSSIAGNDYPTISSLQTNLWETALQNSLLVPPILVSQQASSIYNAVLADVQAKTAAGYPPSLIDPWGRLLSYGLLLGPDGGVSDTMSKIAASSNFSNANAPYPVITALGSNVNIDGTCIPQANATQYEFHPYEFGSWDKGVDAFVVSEYLGTSFSAGKPTGNCITGYDQLGYVLGTSSNVFASACSAVPANKTAGITALSLVQNLAYLTAPGAPGIPEDALFGRFPNPFQGLSSSPLVAQESILDLVDGGVSVAFQGDPIWPFLHRDVDVIVVSANSADTKGNFPNGSEIYNTYQVASAAGLTRMPVIPNPDVFAAKGLNTKPSFFGCNSADTATIVYIPNTNYTFPSGQPTSKIQYFKNETQGMISNGVQIANYGGKQNWPMCLACGLMKKSGGSLPAGCTACFAEYCFN